MKFFACMALGLIAGVAYCSCNDPEVFPAPLIEAAMPEAGVSATDPGPWNASQVILPQVLAARISRGEGGKLSIIQVGFSFQYRNKHIYGAVFAGPGTRPQGLSMLRAVVKDLPRDREVILYCGCCPWDDCPNTRPAFLLLRELGFSQVKVLKIPDNFAKDWADRGFPVEVGSPATPTAGMEK